MVEWSVFLSSANILKRQDVILQLIDLDICAEKKAIFLLSDVIILYFFLNPIQLIWVVMVIYRLLPAKDSDILAGL